MPDDLAEVGDQPAVDLDTIRRMYDDTNDFLFWRVSPAVAAAAVPGLVDEVAYLRRQRDELHREYTELLAQTRAERDAALAEVERERERANINRAALGRVAGERDRARWELPAEPGPEVTAVRDRIGARWIHATKGWRYDARMGALWSWQTLLKQLAPITDATSEVAQPDDEEA